MLVAITKLANVGVCIFFAWLVYDNGGIDDLEELAVLLVPAVALLSLYTLTFMDKEQEDSLVSLWIKVRKKKLKSQLDE